MKKALRKKNQKPKKPITCLQEKLGYSFQNTFLLEQALTRTSAVNEGLRSGRDYQRLEFLGDRVLNLGIAILIFEHYKKIKQGDLKNIKVPGLLNQVYEKLVSNNQAVLPAVGRTLQLEQYIIRGKGEGFITDKMYADAVEAILGAAYLDCNDFNQILILIRKLWLPYLIPELDCIKPELLNLSIVNDMLNTKINESDLEDEWLYNDEEFELEEESTTEWYERNSYIFNFRRQVLHWDFLTLDKRPFVFNQTPPIKLRYRSSTDYYNAFKPYIKEETRTMILRGMELVKKNKANQLRLSLIKMKKPNNQESPILLEMQGKLPSAYQSGASSMLLLLSPYRDKRTKLYGIGSVSKLDEINRNEKSELLIRNFKIRIKPSDMKNYYKYVNKWSAYVLGSLVTYERLYHLCKLQPSIRLQNDLLAGKTRKGIISTSKPIAELVHLNPPQRQAIQQFLALDSGIQAIQGPPGTGKTTMIVALLETLVKYSQDRILVCAPSNKAICVLAKRFLEKLPEVPVIISGVEKKLAPDLRKYFLHNWAKTKLQTLNQLQQVLSELQQKIYSDVTGKILMKSSRVQLLKQLHLIIKFCNQVKLYYSDCLLPYREIRTLNLLLKERWIDNSLILRPLWILNYQLKQLSQTLTCISRSNAKGKPPLIEIKLLNQARIIFCTLVVAGRVSMQKMDQVDTLIIDEASQCTEAESLLPFVYNPRKCLLVGDTKQLPAVVLSSKSRQKHFDRSLLNRLIGGCKQRYSLLTIQYRMDPAIRQWPSKRFYGNKLIDAPCVVKRADRLDNSKSDLLGPCVFVDVASGREKMAMHSYRNDTEAELITKLIVFLSNRINIKERGKIGVISFYAAQVELIKNQLKQAELSHVDVCTVDGFQGDERAIIIISFVRANLKHQVGFIDDPRRLNVAITRAKHSLIMLGQADTLKAKKNAVSHMLRALGERKLVFSETQFNTLFKYVPWPQVHAMQSQFKLEMPPYFELIDKIHLIIKRPVSFPKQSLFQQALTRMSAIEERLYHAATESYQDLEWLGDRVFNFLAAYRVYQDNVDAGEGLLSKRYYALVSNQNSFLTAVAKRLELAEHIIKGNGEANISEKMLADAAEALFAALYLQHNNEKLLIIFFNTLYCEYMQSKSEFVTERAQKSEELPAQYTAVLSNRIVPESYPPHQSEEDDFSEVTLTEALAQLELLDL